MNLYSIIQNAHSGLAYLALAILIVVVLSALMGMMGNKPYTEGNRKLALFGLIGAHIQLLLGLILYFVSPNGFSNFSGANMKDSTARLLMLEHPLMMLIAIILITVGYSTAKKIIDGPKRHKRILIFYGLGLILILSRIPWSNWF